MRYLVLGDIHANLPALAAVLESARPRRVDAGLFVGDLVGYGPEPLACLRMLRDWQREGWLTWVAGNHDLAARDGIPASGYIPEAVQTLTWTRQQLADQPAERAFLDTAPPSRAVHDGIWLTHDSLLEPASGTYQRNLTQATRELVSLSQQGGRICFYGHTHRLRADVLHPGHGVAQRPLTAYTAPDLDHEPLTVLPHEAAWIGVGSVGLPVNDARHAEYLILDTDDPHLWLVEKYAVPYPRHETRAQLHHHLPPACSPEVVQTIARWL